MTENWTVWHTIGLFVIFLAIALTTWQISTEQTLLLWLLTLGALLLFALVAGHGVTGRFWLGLLINEQNRISLSRLQMLLWTLIVLSASLTAVSINLKEGDFEKAVAIEIPDEVLIAMGASTTSLVGSPLILEGKRKKERARVEKKFNLSII